jgi:rare lipoprotein A (peptidoglycan hydrolase)
VAQAAAQRLGMQRKGVIDAELTVVSMGTKKKH